MTSALVILIGCMVLLGWLFNLAPLKSLLPGLATMKANTALSFILIGGALWMLCNEPITPVRRRLAQICAAALFLIGTLTLVEYIFGWNLGIDQLLFRDTVSSAGSSFPGRMAEASAFSFVLMGVALWLTSQERQPVVTQLLTLIIMVIGLFALAGYLYAAAPLYGLFGFASVSFLTAVALLLSGFSLLLTRPRRGLIAALSSPGSGGIMARRLLPTALLLPLIIGWLRLKGQEQGLYGTEVGLALFAVATIITFALLIWWSARLLNDLDSERRQNADRIRRLNRTLAVLSDINQAIVRTRHLPILYEKACQIAIETGKFRLIWIGLIDPVSGRVTLAAHASVSDDYQARLTRTVSDDIRMQTLTTALRRAGNHVVFNDIQSNPNISPEGREDGKLLDFQSLVLLPLTVSGALRGVICLYAQERQRFDSEELRLLDEMAGDIAFAMEFAEREIQRQETEVALLASESRYHRALDSLLEGAEIIGFDWRYLYVNDASAGHGRQSKEVLLRSTVIELYPRVENTGMFAGLRRCMEERVAQHFETEFAFPDGTKTWFDLSVQPIPEGIFILSLDITERKRTEAALQRYAQRMEILHEIDQGIIQGGSIQALVEATLRHVRQIIPYQRANVRLIDTETGEGIIFALDANGQTPLDQVLLDPVPADFLDDYDARHILVVDDLRPMEEHSLRAKQFVGEGMVSCLTVLLIEQDRPIGTLGFLANTPAFFTVEYQEIAAEIANQLVIAIRQLRLTEEIAQHANKLEQKVAERTTELTDAKERAEAILNNSTDGILLVHLNLSIQQTNFSFNRLVDCEPDTYFGESLITLIHGDDANLVLNTIRAVLAERHSKSIEIRLLRKNGTDFDAELSIAHIKDDGLVCTFRDISGRKTQERQLRYFASLQESVLDAVIVTDTEFHIQSWNPGAERIYGWKAHEVIGKAAPELLQIHRSPAQNLESLTQEFNEQGFLQQETIQRRKDNTDIVILGSATRLADENGVAVGVISVNRDISERKQVEYALRESEKKFRSLVVAAPIAMVIADQTGYITLVNEQTERLFGYNQDELVGQLVEILIPEPLRNAHVHHRATYAAAPHVRRMGIGLELFAKRKDGSEFPTEIELSYVETDAGLLIITFIVDITERKERERQLRFNASLQENVTDAVIATDLDFRIQGWNKAAEKIYGWSVDEVMGKSVQGVLRTEFESDEIKERVLHDFLEKGQWTDEFIQRHKDDRAIHVLGSTVLFKDEHGQPFGIVSVNHDITERKHAEQALNAKIAVEREFQGYLKALHEITIELAQIDQLDDFYKHVVEQGLERLGIERLGLLLYDAEQSSVTGTYGTDAQGKLMDEHHIRFDPKTLTGILIRSLEKAERFAFDEHTPLFSNLEPIGFGWNAAAVLWNGEQNLGWLAADNAVYHKPASKPLLDILSLYALNIGTLLARKQIEAALRESEVRYRLLADTVNDVVMRFTPTFEYLYVSPSSRTVLGYEPEELLGRSDFQRIHPEDVPPIQALVKRLVEHPGSAAITYRFRHKQGRYIWLENTGQAVVSEQTGKVVEFVFSARDVTDRIAAEEAVRESEARYRLLAENITDVILRLNTLGEYMYVSPSSRTVLGYEPEELLGKVAFNYVHPDDLATVAQGLAMAGEENPLDISLVARFRHKRGHYVWLESFGKVIHSEKNGEIEGFISSSRDISDRKQAEAALLEQRDFLQLVVNNVPGLIMVKDREGRFQLVNNLIAEVYGVAQADMIGKTDADLNPNPEEVAFFAEKDQETLSSGQSSFIPEEILLDRYYQTSKIPLSKTDGVYDRLLIVASDITEHKKAEEVLRHAFKQEKELGELKSRFVSMASHEFRTPLATILASAETLSAYRSKLTENQIEHRINNIRDQVEHLKNIIEDVLQLARIQAGKLEFNPVLLNLDGLCRSVIDEFESRPDITQQLVYRCDEVLQQVSLDKKLIRQIINNLVSNAVKYSPEGEKVFIDLEYTRDAVVLSVRDQGIGIPEADLKHLFEPFHRAGNVGAISGTGLGLLITKEAVELHSGTIEVDSQVGVGTTVFVTIPISIQRGNAHDENPGH